MWYYGIFNDETTEFLYIFLYASVYNLIRHDINDIFNWVVVFLFWKLVNFVMLDETSLKHSSKSIAKR